MCVCAGGCQCGCFGVDEYLRGVCVCVCMSVYTGDCVFK